MWNERRTEGTPFLEAYERLLLNYGTDYREVAHRYADDSLIRPFFAADELRLRKFDNQQTFDFDGLRGRLMSASYVPEAGHENFGPMMEALVLLFEEHARGGRVVLEAEPRHRRVGRMFWFRRKTFSGS